MICDNWASLNEEGILLSRSTTESIHSFVDYSFQFIPIIQLEAMPSVGMKVETNSTEMIVDNPQMPFSLPESEKVSNEGTAKKPKLSFSPLISPTAPRKFKLGMIIDSSSTTDGHISSIAKPSSLCSLSDLVVLDTNERGSEAMNRWLKKNSVTEGTGATTIHWGEDGFQELLESDIEAIYIIVPAE